jgi:hypothetical protein
LNTTTTQARKKTTTTHLLEPHMNHILQDVVISVALQGAHQKWLAELVFDGRKKTTRVFYSRLPLISSH